MVTLADIFQQYGPAYCAQFGDQLLSSHRQAIRAIVQCRTPALGGHVYHCDACEQSLYYYHSCRNRHCPQCQGNKAAQWLARQQAMLLPLPYYLLTFTLPAELRPLARSQQRLFYNLLFRASAQATQQLAQNPRFLGGDIGLAGVLHTWGRDLSYHPHVHYLVPAGAWDGQVWRWARHKRFLLPVKTLSRLFRAKVRDALSKTPLFEHIPAAVWRKPWVVHCQPAGSGQRALDYLAPYVFRVTITNRRLVSLTDGAEGSPASVTFRYRPSGSHQWRLCTVTAETRWRCPHCGQPLRRVQTLPPRPLPLAGWLSCHVGSRHKACPESAEGTSGNRSTVSSIHRMEMLVSGCPVVIFQPIVLAPGSGRA